MEDISTARWRAGLLAVFALSVGIRLLPAGHVFDGGSVYLVDGDCYVHVRKVLLHIASYPRFISFDPYEGYPHGTWAVWPPFLDWLWAGLCMVLGLGRPDARLAETVMALTPAVTGGLGAVAASMLCRRIMPAWAAMLAGAALALMPGHIMATVVGRPDNEMVEPLMTALLFLSYMRMQGRDDGINWRGIALTAVTSFLMLLLWRGATLWMGLLAGAILIDITFDRRPGVGAVSSALVFGIVSGAIGVMAALNLWGRQNTISFNVISWFHVIVFASCAIMFLAYARAVRMRDRMGYMFYPALMGAVAVVLVLASWLSPELRLNLVRGLGVVGIGSGGRDPWIDSIAQYWPMFYPGPFSLMPPAHQMGWAFWLMPLVSGHIAWGLYREGYQRDRALLALLIVFTFALALIRRRFVNVASVGAALTTAYLVWTLYVRLKGDKGWMVALASFVLLLSPVLAGVYRLPAAHPGDSIKGAYEDAALWMRDQTPQASDPYGADRPLYGVMAEWDMAGWLEYPAQRPVVATMYGTEAPGMLESAKFFLATDEAQADEIMERSAARYLVLTQDIADVQTYAALVGGVRAQDFMTYARVPQTGELIYNYGPRYAELVATRLLLVDGSEDVIDGVKFAPLHHYRLAYESREPMRIEGFPRTISAIKIFERVRGARLEVKAAQGAEVGISTRVRTNIGREFIFRLTSRAGADGLARFTLPYASTYDLRVGERLTALAVSDEDVRMGRDISR